MRPLGQMLLVGVPGTELDADTERRFRHIQAGGYILFGRNIESPRQLRRLIDSLRELSEIEPIITIDQEGGRVSRLRTIGSEPPSALELRRNGDHSLIRRHGELTGRLLRLFGFNLDLCPVLDVAHDDEADNSLRGRCYGNTPEQVVELAAVFNDALRNEGILSCGKHFPGYSLATVDPHHELPVIDKPLSALETCEFLPFRALLPQCDSTMVGHTWLPCFDPERPNWPSSLSANTVDGYLRKRLGFAGLVMTDDLDMGAVLDGIPFDELVLNAIRAGNDVAMICHRIEMAEIALDALERLEAVRAEQALQRIAAFKRKLPEPRPFSVERFAVIDAEIGQLRIDTVGEEAAALRSLEDGKRSPVESY
ncbi:MAG: glycoside hydrolase family 3 N-terminal domain-containing protein [Pseudomonadota bacterium]